MWRIINIASLHMLLAISTFQGAVAQDWDYSDNSGIDDPAEDQTAPENTDLDTVTDLANNNATSGNSSYESAMLEFRDAFNYLEQRSRIFVQCTDAATEALNSGMDILVKRKDLLNKDSNDFFVFRDLNKRLMDVHNGLDECFKQLV